MTYCTEFRRHILAVRDEECLTFAETAERFSVGIASLTRWAKDPEPKAFREGRPRKVDLERLAKDVAERPDDYQHERAARFGVSTTAIWRGLGKLALTHKKTPAPSEGG